MGVQCPPAPIRPSPWRMIGVSTLSGSPRPHFHKQLTGRKMTTRQLCKLMDDCEQKGYKEGFEDGYKAGQQARSPITDALAALKRGDRLDDVIDSILNG